MSEVSLHSRKIHTIFLLCINCYIKFSLLGNAKPHQYFDLCCPLSLNRQTHTHTHNNNNAGNLGNADKLGNAGNCGKQGNTGKLGNVGNADKLGNRATVTLQCMRTKE